MLSSDRKTQLQKLLKSIRLKIKNLDLLNTALTHSSYFKEHKKTTNEDNERLEFFGDAVLKLYVSEYIMKEFSDYSEGELSNLRAYVVSEKVLTKIAQKLNLEKYMLVAKGIKVNIPDSVISNALEAVLAVIYYDSGVETARDFILKNWTYHIDLANKNKEKDNYKAVLQEFTQANNYGLPLYKILEEKGPDHKKIFEVGVFLLNNEVARGSGKNKKEASQNAAYNALKTLNK